MLLDDFIECGEHRGDCVVARPDVPLRISARQFLYKVPHRIFPCKQICQLNVWTEASERDTVLDLHGHGRRGVGFDFWGCFYLGSSTLQSTSSGDWQPLRVLVRGRTDVFSDEICIDQMSNP